MTVQISGSTGIDTVNNIALVSKTIASPTLTGTVVLPSNIITSVWGTGVSGDINWSSDLMSDINATTITISSEQTPVSQTIIKATGNVTIGSSITVDSGQGMIRGSFPVTHGGMGTELGAILKTLGTTGIPLPMVTGTGTVSQMGGIVQILSGGIVNINSTITANAPSAASGDGGGGGGLVVIIAKTDITGSGNISVAAATGHSTADGKGGAGGFSGERGGHAGIGGSGGGSGYGGGSGGSGGSGYVSGTIGGSATGNGGGGGGGCLDDFGKNSTYTSGVAGYGGPGGVAGAMLSNTEAPQTIFLRGYARPAYAGAGGAGGVWNSGPGTSGSSCSSINPGVGSGGGGGGGGAGGNNLGSVGTHGQGGVGSSGISPFVLGQGNGGGGAGGNGGGSNASPANGGAGGNGGGASGLVIMIAPSITWSGTVTGRLVQITGSSCYEFLKSFST